MKTCPTCGATYGGGLSCHRCKTAFHEILAVEDAASEQRRLALLALDGGRMGEARRHAERACILHRTQDSLVALALVALRDRDYFEVVNLWREIRQSPDYDDSKKMALAAIESEPGSRVAAARLTAQPAGSLPS